MPYGKQTWNDLDTTKPLSAARMNNIEDGIESAHISSRTQPPYDLRKYGVILYSGESGKFDEALLEGGCMFFDPNLQLWACVYVGYDGTLQDGNTPVAGWPSDTSRGRVGYAVSHNKLTWWKATAPDSPFFEGSNIPGAPDAGSITGPLVLPPDDPLVTDGLYHMWYIGCEHIGYEGYAAVGLGQTPERTICHATAPGDSWPAPGDWTRDPLNPLIVRSGATTGIAAWRYGAVWRPHIVKRGETFYMFFNATDVSGTEVIGYASAPTLWGPWTIDDANSPIIPMAAQSVADPFIERIGDTWYMYYTGPGGFLYTHVQHTSDNDFPLGWTFWPLGSILSTGAPWDNAMCGKGWFVRDEGGYWCVHSVAHGTGATRTWEIGLAVDGPEKREKFRKIGTTGNPAFGTNITNSGGPARTAGFARDTTGRVTLEGLIKATGTIAFGSTLFRLPRGYAPGQEEYFLVPKNGPEGHASIVVSTDGVVSSLSGQLVNNDTLNLNGIEWTLGV